MGEWAKQDVWKIISLFFCFCWLKIQALTPCFQAIQQHHKRIRFLSTIELVNLLEQEKQIGKQGRMANRLIHTDLVILDELGYLPFSQAGGALLFHLLRNNTWGH